jgi:hypothetical protein
MHSPRTAATVSSASYWIAAKSVEERRARHIGDLCRLRLRHTAEFVSLDGRGQPHFPHKPLWVQAHGSVSPGRQIQADARHGDLLARR